MNIYTITNQEHRETTIAVHNRAVEKAHNYIQAFTDDTVVIRDGFTFYTISDTWLRKVRSLLKECGLIEV